MKLSVHSILFLACVTVFLVAFALKYPRGKEMTVGASEALGKPRDRPLVAPIGESYDGGRKAVQLDAPPRENRQALEGIDDCLKACADDLLELRECMRLVPVHLQPSAAEIAALYCTSEPVASPLSREDKNRSLLIVQGMMRSRNGDGVVEFLNDLQSVCSDFREPLYLMAVVNYLCDAGDEWIGWMEAGLEPHLLFGDDALHGTIYLAAALAEKGSQWARYLLMEGARGVFQGNAYQIFIAGNMVMRFQVDPKECFGFLESVRQSLSITKENSVGGYLANMYMHPRCWIGGDPDSAVASLLLVMLDERAATDAAIQVLSYIDQGRRPGGIHEDQWKRLRSAGHWDEVLGRARVLKNARIEQVKNGLVVRRPEGYPSR